MGFKPRKRTASTFNRNSLPAMSSEVRSICDGLNLGQSVIINAGAGTGKTTALVSIVAELFMSRSVDYVVFNAKNAEEARAKMPGHVNSVTGHSLAMSQSGGFDVVKYGHFEPKVRYLLGSIFDGAGPEKAKKIAEVSGDVHRLLSLSKTTLCPIDEKSMIKLAQDYGLDSPELLGIMPQLVDFQGRYLAQVLKSKQGNFDDLLYYVATAKTVRRKVDVLMIDEAQDISPALLAILRQIDARQYIAVGDDFQSINGFAGACRTNLFQTFPDAVPYGLLTSYRCPVSHCEAANEYRAQDSMMRPRAGAALGSILEQTWQEFTDSYPDHGLILCRTNADLVQTAIRLYLAGLPFQFNPDNNPLQQIVRPLKCLLEAIPGPSWAMALADYIAENKDIEPRDELDLTAATVEYARLLLDNDVQTVKGLYRYVNTFTAQDQGPVLSTGHRSKGLEARTVALINPSNWGPDRRKGLSDYDRAQESNLLMVGLSRSMDTLIKVTLPKRERKKQDKPDQD